jgi:hypothetical protein
MTRIARIGKLLSKEATGQIGSAMAAQNALPIRVIRAICGFNSGVQV